MKIELHLYGTKSLKEKRSHVNRVKLKLINRFKISVIEADLQEMLDAALLGVAFASLNRISCQKKWTINRKLSGRKRIGHFVQYGFFM